MAINEPVISPCRICFLGYNQLTEMARRVLDSFPFDDCEIDIVDCLPDQLPERLPALATRGYEIYIAGGANAAVFSRHSQDHLLELTVRDVDCMIALKKAAELGNKIGFAWHRHSREINLSQLSSLCGVPAEMISYEDSEELYGQIDQSGCDVVIGASQACSYAAEKGIKTVLIYAGEETVRRSIQRARSMVLELRKERGHQALNQALIRNIPLGIIYTDIYGRISLINQTARDYLALPVGFSKKRMLGELRPNLSPDRFLAREVQKEESFKIIDGIRFRCLQVRVSSRGENTGVLTILRIDNARKNEKAAPGLNAGAARWKELVALSDSMKQAIALGRKYAPSPLPLILRGDVSLHRQLFAESVHTGSVRAQQPLLAVNLPQISAADAGRHLLGSIDSGSPHTGLIQMADKGTMILKNVQDACPAVQDILLEVLTSHRILPIGGYQPISVDVRFITILDKGSDAGKIRPDLLERLSTLSINLPSLHERREDIPVLFQQALAGLETGDFRIDKYRKAVETLRLYSWPGSTSELEAAAGRFAFLLGDNAKITPHTVHHMMIRAIGEDRLLKELQQRHPCLADSDVRAADFKEAVEDLKYYLGWNNSVIAAALGISRSSLWRDLKDSQSDKEE